MVEIGQDSKDIKKSGEKNKRVQKSAIDYIMGTAKLKNNTLEIEYTESPEGESSAIIAYYQPY